MCTLWLVPITIIAMATFALATHCKAKKKQSPQKRILCDPKARARAAGPIRLSGSSHDGTLSQRLRALSVKFTIYGSSHVGDRSATHAHSAASHSVTLAAY